MPLTYTLVLGQAPSELRRPIFAYMIYQLIINNIDFSSIGKIGVYLSFLNLLTKDAKHIHDTTYQVNLSQEFEFRNLLHAISALWMYERQQGKQGGLTKANICRILDRENKKQSDAEILERYKHDDVIEIQFLSHSYFGEKDNVLHFQHQSFAEILLAEYYLKVFIKYALDEEFDVEEARTRLVLGEPTAQTIQFLTEMLTLLKETATEDNSKSQIEKRKLLFPLMASLATKKNNKLFCNAIFYDWYKHCDFHENEVNYPNPALENWCIDKEKLDKIITLARAVIESKTNYILAQADPKTALFDNELLAIQDKMSSYPPDIDRWLALLVGNTLHNDEKADRYFNWDIKNFTHILDLIRNWNYAFQTSAPEWGNGLFKAINMFNNMTRYSYMDINVSNLDFSHSRLINVHFTDSAIWRNEFLPMQRGTKIIVEYYIMISDQQSEIDKNNFLSELGDRLSKRLYTSMKLDRQGGDEGYYTIQGSTSGHDTTTMEIMCDVVITINNAQNEYRDGMKVN